MTAIDIGFPHSATESAVDLTMLRYVEVETSRYCNRSCDWCPNGHTDARRHQELMPWPIFTRITDELAQRDYDDGFFAFHNHNEPLANPRLDDEIALVRRVLPLAKPAVYTNGDLLKRDRCEALLDAGAQYLRVTRYPHRADTEPTYDSLRKYLRTARIADLTDWTFAPVRQGLAARHHDERTGATVEVFSPDVRGYNDRGGTAIVLQIGSRRTEPCQMTSTSLSVDFRGDVKMCYNVISRRPAASRVRRRKRRRLFDRRAVGRRRHVCLAGTAS